jgi:hypothetical protein
MRRALVVIAVVMVLIAGIGIYSAIDGLRDDLPIPIPRGCTAQTESGSVKLNDHQMANAATIAAVGLTRGLPDRAIVVALATAMQESELINLAGGDRDSVGLFQQRPSQGWGSPEQIRDPRYAASAFYNQLVRVGGWEQMRLTDAAQAVQRSAFPEAYQAWADEAQVLGDALVGAASGAIACNHSAEPTLRGAQAIEALGAGLRADWGEVATVDDPEVGGVVLAAADTRAGWQFAHWLVAHSTAQNVSAVRYNDREWTAESGSWAQIEADATSAGRVIVEVFRD